MLTQEGVRDLCIDLLELLARADDFVKSIRRRVGGVDQLQPRARVDLIGEIAAETRGLCQHWQQLFRRATTRSYNTLAQEVLQTDPAISEDAFRALLLHVESRWSGVGDWLTDLGLKPRGEMFLDSMWKKLADRLAEAKTAPAHCFDQLRLDPIEVGPMTDQVTRFADALRRQLDKRSP